MDQSFKVSCGWFACFKRRRIISFRHTTHVAQKSVDSIFHHLCLEKYFDESTRGGIDPMTRCTISRHFNSYGALAAALVLLALEDRFFNETCKVMKGVFLINMESNYFSLKCTRLVQILLYLIRCQK